MEDSQKIRDYESKKRHYEKNKDVIKERAKLHTKNIRIKIRRFIAEYLLENPCIDCGEDDLVVLEFDHRDPSEKTFALGASCASGYSLSKIAAEIAKCDVRCANCHRRKTYKERGFTHRTI